MSASFEAEVANNLRAIASSVTALSAKYTELERRGTSAAQRVAGELKKVGAVVDHVERKTMTLGQRMQRMASATGKLGGPIGEGAGRVLSGFGMGGGIGIAGGVAGGLALAGRVLSGIDREHLEQQRQILAIVERRAQIERDATKTRQQQGVAAVQSQGNTLRQLRTRGGDLAMEWADNVAASGVTSTAEAQAGVAKAFTLTKPGQREAVMSAAFLAAMTGELGFSQAVGEASDPAMLERLTRPGGTDDVVSRMMVKARGQPMTPANLFNAKNDMHWTREESMQRGTLLGEIAGTSGQLNQVDVMARERITSGDARAGASSALAAAADPTSAALVELNREQSRKLTELSRLASEQLTVLKWWKESYINRFLMGGERSEAGKLQQAHQAFGAE